MDLLEGTKDARGRTLMEGDEVILNTPDPIYFRIAKIEPHPDPSATPDMLMLHIGAMVPYVAKRGLTNRQLIRVRTLEEAGPANFVTLEPPTEGKLIV